jgi:glucose 1-dehydrogenase
VERFGEGKKALVTGASRGIGKGIALAMASEGYDLCITYSKSKDEAESVAATIRNAHGRRCIILHADMDKENDPGRVVERAASELGQIDVLVNNAGKTIFEPITEMTEENLNYLINLDFKAYLLAARAASKHMIERQIKGSIINITSTRGKRAYPGDAVYGGMKAALERAMESIALDLAPYGIRVNCIAPGAIRVRDTVEAKKFYESLSKRIPLGREGVPSDIGNAVVWLASEKASYITGTTLKIDGGLTLPGMPEREEKSEYDNWITL